MSKPLSSALASLLPPCVTTCRLGRSWLNTDHLTSQHGAGNFPKQTHRNPGAGRGGTGVAKQTCPSRWGRAESSGSAVLSSPGTRRCSLAHPHQPVPASHGGGVFGIGYQTPCRLLTASGSKTDGLHFAGGRRGTCLNPSDAWLEQRKAKGAAKKKQGSISGEQTRLSFFFSEKSSAEGLKSKRWLCQTNAAVRYRCRRTACGGGLSLPSAELRTRAPPQTRPCTHTHPRGRKMKPKHVWGERTEKYYPGMCSRETGSA